MEIIDIDNLMLKLNESYLSLIKNTIIETHKLKKSTLKFQQMLQIFMLVFFKVKTDLDTIQWKYMYSHKQLKYHIMIWHKPFQRSETAQKEGIHFFKNSTVTVSMCEIDMDVFQEPLKQSSFKKFLNELQWG